MSHVQNKILVICCIEKCSSMITLLEQQNIDINVCIRNAHKNGRSSSMTQDLSGSKRSVWHSTCLGQNVQYGTVPVWVITSSMEQYLSESKRPVWLSITVWVKTSNMAQYLSGSKTCSLKGIWRDASMGPPTAQHRQTAVPLHSVQQVLHATFLKGT